MVELLTVTVPTTNLKLLRGSEYELEAFGQRTS